MASGEGAKAFAGGWKGRCGASAGGHRMAGGRSGAVERGRTGTDRQPERGGVPEWPHTAGGGELPPLDPHLRFKVTIAGKNEIYNRDHLARPFLVHKLLGPPPPPRPTTKALCQPPPPAPFQYFPRVYPPVQRLLPNPPPMLLASGCCRESRAAWAISTRAVSLIASRTKLRRSTYASCSTAPSA